MNDEIRQKLYYEAITHTIWFRIIGFVFGFGSLLGCILSIVRIISEFQKFGFSIANAIVYLFMLIGFIVVAVLFLKVYFLEKKILSDIKEGDFYYECTRMINKRSSVYGVHQKSVEYYRDTTVEFIFRNKKITLQDSKAVDYEIGTYFYIVEVSPTSWLKSYILVPDNE